MAQLGSLLWSSWSWLIFVWYDFAMVLLFFGTIVLWKLYFVVFIEDYKWIQNMENRKQTYKIAEGRWSFMASRLSLEPPQRNPRTLHSALYSPPPQKKQTTNSQFFVTFLGLVSDPFKWLSDLQLGDEKFTLNHLARHNKILCWKTIEFFHQKHLWNSWCGWPESTVGWLVGWLVGYQTNTFHHLLVATLAKHGSELHLWFLQVFRHHIIPTKVDSVLKRSRKNLCDSIKNNQPRTGCLRK